MESRPALSDVLKRTQDLLTALKSQAQKGEKRDVAEQQTQSSPISLGRSVQWETQPEQQQHQQHQVNTPTSGTPASTPARNMGQLQMVAPPELGNDMDTVMGKSAIGDFLEMKRNYLHYLAATAMGTDTPEALPLGPRMQAAARSEKSAFDDSNDADLEHEATPDSYSAPDIEQRELEINHDITSLDKILNGLGRRPCRSKLVMDTAPRQTYLELFQKWGIYQPQKHLTELQQYDHFIQLQHKKATLASSRANDSTVPSISTRTPRRGSLRSGTSRRVSESSSTGTTSSWRQRSAISKELRHKYPHLIATAEGSTRLGSISTAN